MLYIDQSACHDFYPAALQNPSQPADVLSSPQSYLILLDGVKIGGRINTSFLG